MTVTCLLELLTSWEGTWTVSWYFSSFIRHCKNRFNFSIKDFYKVPFELNTGICFWNFYSRRLYCLGVNCHNCNPHNENWSKLENKKYFQYTDGSPRLSKPIWRNLRSFKFHRNLTLDTFHIIFAFFTLPDRPCRLICCWLKQHLIDLTCFTVAFWNFRGVSL